MLASLPRFRVDVPLLLVAAAWGSTYLVAKLLVTPRSVIALLALRMLVAASIMAAIVAIRHQPLTRAEVRAGAIIGGLLAGVFAFETFGIAHTSATNAGLIIALTVLFTPLLDACVSGRRLPRTFVVAAVIAVTGTVLLAGNGSFHTPGPGDLLVLLAAIVRAVHVITMHRLTAAKPMDSLNLTAVQLGVCAAIFTMISPFYGDSVPDYLARLSLHQVLLFSYLAVVCTVFAFLVQTWAVRRTSPARVSLLLGTEPLWAAAIGMTIAHDSFGAVGYLGAILILAGTQWGRVVEQRHRAHVAPISKDLAWH